MKTSVRLCFFAVSTIFRGCFCCFVVVRVCAQLCVVPKTQIPNVSAVANNNGKILINYSCLFGPHTHTHIFSETEHAVCYICKWNYLQFRLNPFPTLFIFLPLHCSLKRYYTSLIRFKQIRSLIIANNFLISPVRKSNFVIWKFSVLNFKRTEGKKRKEEKS